MMVDDPEGDVWCGDDGVSGAPRPTANACDCCCLSVLSLEPPATPGLAGPDTASLNPVASAGSSNPNKSTLLDAPGLPILAVGFIGEGGGGSAGTAALGVGGYPGGGTQLE